MSRHARIAARSASRSALARPRLVAGLAIALVSLGSLAACGGSALPPRPPAAEKWLQRASADYKVGEIADAKDAVDKALALVPADEEVRLLGARIALARLEFAEALRLLKDVKGSEASGLRGRALWYKGDLEAAADELDALLMDPEVKDDWAKSIAKLARRGAGRAPFKVGGGLLASVDMPHTHPFAPYFVVPVEIDGEDALAAISTASAEVVLDSSSRPEPGWVSLRFGKRLEVSDVPALTRDLSGISKQMNAPIKALLGVNVLRHLNVTVDFSGRQFVARSYSPPAPPQATKVDLFYLRGGGMLMNGSLGATRASLLVDTAMQFPIALDQGGWKKAGLDASTLRLIPEDPEKKLREGIVPLLKVGAFDVPKVPGVFGTPFAEIEKELSLDLDGAMGCGMLAAFRVTFADQGRFMWLEDSTAVLALLGMDPSGGAGPQGQPRPENSAEPPLGPGQPGLGPTQPGMPPSLLDPSPGGPSLGPKPPTLPKK